MTRGIKYFGVLALGAILMSSSSLSKFDMKMPAGVEIAESKFHFKYSGEVPTGAGVMPLVGQLSKDGTNMYFSSQSNSGDKFLYKMSRTAPGEDFSAPTKVKGKLNDGSYDIIMPTVSADEKTLIFVNSLSGLQKGNDLFMATLDEATGEYGQIRALTEVNDPNLSDSYPWLSADGNRLYFTKQFGSDIKFYISERKSAKEPFGAGKELGITLPKVSNNMSCMLNSDETELYALSGNFIYHAERKSTKDDFSIPVEIANTDNSGYLSGITLTDDAKELFVYNSVGFRNTQILRFVNTGKDMTAPTINAPGR